MKKIHAPLLLPAAALWAGTALAPQLVEVCLPGLAALALLGLALGRRAGLALVFASLGAMSAAVRLDLPRPARPSFDPGRPVEALATPSLPWSRDEHGWATEARLTAVRQGGEVRFPTFPVALRLPDPETPPPALGSTLRVRGYLLPSTPMANGDIQGTPATRWRLSVESRLLAEVERGPGPFLAAAGALRRRVEAAFQAAAPAAGKSPGVALARAFVLGDAGGLPDPWKRGLRLTGLYHLLSVSGVHVALLGLLVWGAAAFLPRPVRLGLMLAAFALYVALVGPLPPLVRSAVMGGLAVAALLAERPPAAVNALAAAAMFLLLADPAAAGDLSFVLSAAATAALLLLAPPLADRLRRHLPAAVALPLAASFAAELATLPWLLPRTFVLSPLAPLFNLVAIPWTGLFLAAAFAWTAVAGLAPALAARAVPVLDLLAAPLGWPASLRPSPLWMTPIALGAAAASGLALGLATALLAKRRPVRWAGAAAAALLLGWGFWGIRPPAWPQLSLLDVGQGDAILLADRGHAALIDGGGFFRGDIGGKVLLPALLAAGVRHLDLIAMTHPDLDHCNGLVDLTAYLPVSEVWMGPGWPAEGCAGRLAGIAGGRLRLVSAGRSARVGRWRLSVLHPEAEDRLGENERSLVILAEALGRKALLTGDVEGWGEMRLLACCRERLAVDLLKIAHHGSKTSTTESFLAAAAPRLALISAGVANRFHHPSPVILERLGRHRVPILRTDRDGRVTVEIRPRGPWRIALPGAPK